MTGFDAFPTELRERPQWVLWREEERDPKPTKVPYRADGRHASATDAATWTSYDQAVAAHKAGGFDGIGFVFTTSDPFCGIDLDGCVDFLAGQLDPEAAAIVAHLDSYTEESPSGLGVHVIVRAELNGGRRRAGKLEIYDRDRYFTVTGTRITGTPATVEKRQEQLDEIRARFLADPPPAAQPHAPVPVGLDDRELLDRAYAASNGEELRMLYAGAWQGRYGSQSEADLALCSRLAFWTGRDPARIDALFRSSGLMRAKWDSRRGDATYGELTIARAVEGTTETYNPELRQRQTPPDAVDAVPVLGSGGESERVTASALKDAVTPTHHRTAEDRESDPGAFDADAADAEPSPFALPIRDFIAVERPLRDPLLADAEGRAVLGRASLILLGALGGQGKTTFSVDVFLHLAAGVDYPPFVVPAPVSILMIENEGPEELFAAKLKGRLEHFPHELKARLDVCVFDWGSFSLADSEARQRLSEEIAAKGYELVFGDPLDSLGIQGVGSPEDTRKFMELMKATGLGTSVAWWLNTHPRKEETREALNEIAGAWGGKPDSVLLLKMLDDDRTQLRFPKLRWTRRGTRPPILLGFDADTEAFSYLGEQAEEVRDYLREVFALLAQRPWLTVKEISVPAKEGGIGANEKTVKAVLEEHPDIFELRSGEDAVALGRKSSATLWGLRPDAAENLADLEDDA
jgi:hypothetical protein